VKCNILTLVKSVFNVKGQGGEAKEGYDSKPILRRRTKYGSNINSLTTIEKNNPHNVVHTIHYTLFTIYCERFKFVNFVFSLELKV